MVVRCSRRLFSIVLDIVSYLRILGRRILCREVQLIIGDSHAIHLGGYSSVGRYVAKSVHGNAYTIWLGPKLLRSVAVRGLPRWVEILLSARWAVHCDRATVVVHIVLGEIDIRCHLVSRLRLMGEEAILSLGNEFLAFIATLSRFRGIRAINYYEPTPPSDIGEENTDYPRVGTLAERLYCHALLSTQIKAGIECNETLGNKITFIANPPECTLPNGALKPDWTNDGCHFNRSVFLSVDPSYAPQGECHMRDGKVDEG